MHKKAFSEITQGFSSHLKFLSELGCPGLDCSTKSVEILKGWGALQPDNTRSASGIINQSIKCRDCSLSTYRRQMVCGAGDSNACLAIVGGAATPEDGKSGTPYSGQAGDLLDKMLGAMHLTRNQVYITRAVKCCPPEGRKLTLTDVNICRLYLSKELGLVRPDLILAFGEIAAMSLLETSMSLSRLRGRFHDFRGMRVIPTYSPEHLLKDVSAKREVWEDLKQVMVQLKKSASQPKKLSGHSR